MAVPIEVRFEMTRYGSLADNSEAFRDASRVGARRAGAVRAAEREAVATLARTTTAREEKRADTARLVLVLREEEQHLSALSETTKPCPRTTLQRASYKAQRRIPSSYLPSHRTVTRELLRMYPSYAPHPARVNTALSSAPDGGGACWAHVRAARGLPITLLQALPLRPFFRRRS